MGTTSPSFLQWGPSYACAQAGQTSVYIKAAQSAGKQQLEVGRWRARLGGEVGEEVEEELSEGGGREEKRRRRRTELCSIEPKGR